MESFKPPTVDKSGKPVDPNKLLIDDIKKEFLNSKKIVDDLYATKASSTSPKEVNKQFARPFEKNNRPKKME